MSLSPKKHADRIILDSHGNEDATAWLIETDDPMPGLIQTTDAATAAFFRRVNAANAADPLNQYVTDRALGRVIFEAAFIDMVVTVSKNHLRYIADRTYAALARTTETT